MSLISSKVYDRRLCLVVEVKSNEKFVHSSLTTEEKKEKMKIAFEVGKPKGRTKVITREEHEAFLTMAYIGDAKALVHFVVSNDPDIIERQNEARKWVEHSDMTFLYDYCYNLLRKKHWTLNEISSDFRIE